jgi:hypothetical protein
MTNEEYLKQVLIPSMTERVAAMCLAFLMVIRGAATLK